MEINLGKNPFDRDFHPSSSIVAASLINGYLHMYRYAADSMPQRLFEIHAHDDSCRAVRFIDSGRAVLTASHDCSIRATDVETGISIACLEDAHGAPINRLFNLTETTVSSGDGNGCIKGYFKDCSDRFLGHPMSVDSMLKLDEDALISGSEDGVIRLVGILPNRIIQPIAEHLEYPIEGLAFSHDRKFLGGISHDQMLKLWDLHDVLEGWKNALMDEAVAADSDDDEMDVDKVPKSS